jgi:protein TonB
VVAAAPKADDPLDFTDFTIATGQAQRYAGGVTAANGTNSRAVHAPAVDRNAAPDRAAGAASLARPVRLEARDWRCPWPEQADLLSVDEERVVIRVDVDAAGAVTAASVLEDPGHGFGDAALRCARRHRFVPALDASGRAIAATSPPIRVRFTR